MADPAERIAAALERIATAEERQADALERLATEPSGRLPARQGSQRRRPAPRPANENEGPVDEVTRERAQRALDRLGLG